jgi:hypothetical protein
MTMMMRVVIRPIRGVQKENEREWTSWWAVQPREAVPVEAEVGWRSTMVVFSNEMGDSHAKLFKSSLLGL